MKVCILVCSENQYFVDCFSSYIMEHGKAGFEFAFFTEKEAAVSYLSSRVIDLILADELFFHEYEISGKCVPICISNQTKLSKEGFLQELNIYQRGVDILGDLQKIAAVMTNKKERSTANKEHKVITFYSPQGGAGKTSLAYICALLYAQDKTGIYLNMEEFGYTDHLYQTEFETEMEEVIFAIKDHRDISASLSNILKKDKRNVTVLPIVKNISDFIEMTAEDIQILIKKIFEIVGSGCLFLDLSGGLSERNRALLEFSDMIFWVFQDDVCGRGKMDRMKNDESMREISYYDRSYFVINKCKNKTEDTSAIHIPFSESLSRGVEIETVLSGNWDFYRMCMEMTAIINR